MPDNLIIYVGEKNISSWSMRGYLALAAKELEFEERTISLREDKDRSRRLAVSPTGKVPARPTIARTHRARLAIVSGGTLPG